MGDLLGTICEKLALSGNHIRTSTENQECLDSGVKPTKFGYRCSKTGTEAEEIIVVI